MCQTRLGGPCCPPMHADCVTRRCKRAGAAGVPRIAQGCPPPPPPAASRRRHSLPTPRPRLPAGLRPVVAMAQKTEKKKGKEQEVFLGVKGNAQASRGPAARWPPGWAAPLAACPPAWLAAALLLTRATDATAPTLPILLPPPTPARCACCACCAAAGHEGRRHGDRHLEDPGAAHEARDLDPADLGCAPGCAAVPGCCGERRCSQRQRHAAPPGGTAHPEHIATLLPEL